MRWASVDVTVGRGPLPVPARMAGFRYRSAAPVDLAMIAHPAVTLLFDLSGALVHDTPGGRRHGDLVVGPLPGPVRLCGRGPGEVLQVRLAPGVAAGVVGDPLAGTIVAPADLWGRDAALLTERLQATGSWPERFALVAGFLAARSVHRGVDPEVAHVWRRMLRTGGRARVGDLAAEVGWSRRRLWQRHRAQLGATPKQAARLIRFDRAAHLLAAGRSPAVVAALGGYADQSHLHRDTREFSGLTPAGVAAAPWLAIDDVAWPHRISSGSGG
ncbi:helix-turn-helix domain-containing protein [Actinoplanes sp. G11-F43]|uniref:AraC family transcriptional regulator n=1 Tax=Actinoplanes sp. G11-F43 TaxID=3424130 RepID=UPI003D32ACB0